MNTWFTALGALGYPVAVITGITLSLPLLPLVWLAGLGLRLAWNHLRPGGRLLLALALAALVFLLIGAQTGDWLLYALPILIQGGVGFLFVRSLAAGSTPLITRYALAMGAADQPAVHRYTRRLTQVWAALCLTLAAGSLLLAVFASPVTWALFANGVHYVLLAALFVLEYPLRGRLLNDPSQHGFFAYLLALARLDHHRILRHS